MIIGRQAVLQHLIHGYYTGHNRLDEVSVDKVNEILNKRKIVLYAPFYVKGILNVPIQYPYCNLEDAAMTRAFEKQKEENRKEAKRLKRILKTNTILSDAERADIEKRLYDYKHYSHALIGK